MLLLVKDVVTLRGVTLVDSGASGSTVWGADLDVREGELVIVNLGHAGGNVPLADACSGLHRPSKGTISYRGQDWLAISPGEAARLRGTIGRVFYDGGWLSGIDVAGNIMLAQLHHTSRSRAEIREEAQRRARTFGLPGLPARGVEDVRAADLQRAACARAFMGRPALVILENPTRGVYPAIMAPLMNTIRELRNAGGAVLWLTTAADVWGDTSVTWSRRYQVAGSQLVAVEG